MKILAVTPFHNRVNYQQKSSNSANLSGNIAFSGKNFSNYELDKCLERLALQRKINEEARNAIKIARETADESLQKVNKKINEITDGDFLWFITPDDSKRKWSRVIVERQYMFGEDEKTVWNFVTTKIKENLSSEKPRKILEELEKAGKELAPEHKPMFGRLKSLITEKLNIEETFRKKETEITIDKSHKLFDITLFSSWESLSSVQTFEREIKQRAIETQKHPEVRQIYSENYKQRLAQILPLYKRGRAYQRASEYANSKVFDYLRTGTQKECAF